MCHMSVSFRSFMPYGPISSAKALSSFMSENSSALNGIAPSAVRLMKALWFIEKQMFPALTLLSRTSEYLHISIICHTLKPFTSSPTTGAVDCSDQTINMHAIPNDNEQLLLLNVNRTQSMADWFGK